MKKRRSRICRRIAVALTVALLVGQSQALVLAEEDAGDALQTEISSEEIETDHLDGEDGQDKCICGTKCAEDAVNTDCPVCAADSAACAGKADDTENNDTEKDDTENNGTENVGQENTNGSPEENTDEPDQCVCETACTEDAVNAECPVCAADYANCAKNAGGGVKSSEEEVISENVLDEEAGIAALADEGVEAYAVGDELEDSAGVKYRVTDNDKKEVSVVGHREGKKVKGEITIPKSFENGGVTYHVTSIADDAFRTYGDLTKVTIPEGVTSIGNNAFWACWDLEEATIPEGVTNIGDDVFYQCTSLTKATIPGSVTSMGRYVFSQCTALSDVTIQEGLTRIESGTFGSCTSITKVTIPKGVTSIGPNAFNGCNGLSSVGISGSGASVEIPDSVTTIEEYAFTKCSGLTNVTIPKSVTTLKWAIFAECGNLFSATLSEKVSQIDAGAFRECAKLNNLNVLIAGEEAAGFSEVHTSAFTDCTSRQEVVFWNADGTERLTGAKLDRAKLTYLNAPDGNTDDNEWYGWPIDRPATYAVTIRVNLDDQQWNDHNKTFALREDGDTEFITDLAHVSNGTYSIFDITGVSAATLSSVARDVGTDTGVDVTVQDGNAEATVNYYTATFYDNDGSVAVRYESGALQPQVILKSQTVAQPREEDNPTESKNPAKAGWQFDGWKTADNGADSFDFSKTIKQKIDEGIVVEKGKGIGVYASWRNADTPATYTINASATEGGSISPPGSVSVNGGGSQTFTVTPAEGYRLKAVLVNGEDRTARLTDGKNYTFTNVWQNYNIQAVFERDGGDNPNPNPNPDPGGDNPGGGGDNPTPGGDGDNTNLGGGSGGSGGGTGDNSNPGDGGGSGGGGGNANSGGGNNGGDNTNPDGGNSAANAANLDNGNNAENTQTAAGTETSSVQAGSNAVGVTTADASGQTAGANGTAAGGKEPKTGDTAYWEVYATLAMIAGLTYLLLYVMEESRGMTEREKEAFVAAFIRWGKKGGAFRKCCAMAAIFCLLAYYHTIGKRGQRVDMIFKIS